jgi:hypothetical protein
VVLYLKNWKKILISFVILLGIGAVGTVTFLYYVGDLIVEQVIKMDLDDFEAQIDEEFAQLESQLDLEELEDSLNLEDFGENEFEHEEKATETAGTIEEQSDSGVDVIIVEPTEVVQSTPNSLASSENSKNENSNKSVKDTSEIKSTNQADSSEIDTSQTNMPIDSNNQNKQESNTQDNTIIENKVVIDEKTTENQDREKYYIQGDELITPVKLAVTPKPRPTATPKPDIDIRTIKEIKDNISVADKVVIATKVIGKFSDDEVDELSDMVKGGITKTEKSEIKEIVYPKFSEEEINELKSLYKKYLTK